MAQMKTLNGYEIVDQAVRDRVTILEKNETKNYILNGSFQIDQRGNKTYYNAGYTIDGWKIPSDMRLQKNDNGILITNTGQQKMGRVNVTVTNNTNGYYLYVSVSSISDTCVINYSYDNGAFGVDTIDITTTGVHKFHLKGAAAGNIGILIPAQASIQFNYILLTDSNNQNFTRKSYDEDLAECQKYYYKVNSGNSIMTLKGDSSKIYILLPHEMKATGVKSGCTVKYFGFTSSGTAVAEQTATIAYTNLLPFGVLLVCNIESNNVVNYGFAYLTSNLVLGPQ